MKQRLTITGLKPSALHLGHILSPFRYIDANKNSENIFMLIADLHKYSNGVYSKDLSGNLCGVANKFGIKYIKQTSLPREFMQAYIVLAGVVVADLLKVYKLNYLAESVSEKSSLCYTYPILMALDILCASPCKVCVSKDQIHNIRVMKDIQAQLKQISPDLDFDVQCEILDEKILSLSTGRKMSNSEKDGTISVLDTDEEVLEKVMAAQTMTNMPQSVEDCNQETLNMYTIYATLSGLNVEQVVEKYKSRTFYALKRELARLVISSLNEYRNLDTTYNYSGMIYERYLSNATKMLEILS